MHTQNTFQDHSIKSRNSG